MKAKRRHRKQQISDYQTGKKPFFNQNLQGRESTFFSRNVQAKLTLGSSGDKYEQQADYVAGIVARGETVQKKDDMKIRKQEEEEMQAKIQKQEEEEMQTKLQKQEEEEVQARLQKQEEEEVQAKSIQRKEATLTSGMESKINIQKAGGSPLPEDVRKDLENRMGASFRHVRIHNDNAANQLCEEFNALAFTVGNNIFFKSGQYQPGTSVGRELLAHELTHVLQQRRGN